MIEERARTPAQRNPQLTLTGGAWGPEARMVHSPSPEARGQLSSALSKAPMEAGWRACSLRWGLKPWLP